MTKETISKPLEILSWGTYLPPAKIVKDLVLEKGGDPTKYLTFGWEKICVAEELDYPTSMCVNSLRQALHKIDLQASQLKLVICTSTIHDYPEVVTASEIMREVGVGNSCVGFDIYQGCVTTLTALEIARDWLNRIGGGYAAIVSGERWAESIDKTDMAIDSLWNFSDGASALIVGIDISRRNKLTYQGSCFYNCNEMSGYIRRSFGGARSFGTLPGQNPTRRVLLPIPLPKQFQYFNEGYSKVFSDFKGRFNLQPDWMICNQGTPAVVEYLSYLTKIKSPNVIRSGEKYGHVGCSDLIIGLDELEKNRQLKGSGIGFSCSVSAWGAGLFQIL
jgi:3-oxoacyl-[acyl-carrier-protein] synthase III